MRVAAASSDGINIDRHFGAADTFSVFDLEEETGEIRLVEVRKGKAFCHGGSHEDRELQDAVTLLSDCQKVFVVFLGQGAEDALNARGIEAVVTEDVAPIREALDDYYNTFI